MLRSTNIREKFLGFFEQKAHQLVKSAPIVVHDDPTLMFTNAGMNQFKDIFLGLKNPEFRKVADTQKCLRVSGKHNDLEEVGHDTYHHTMFEMLGNWSFGDYYKKEAIDWAWELLTEIYGLNPDQLYATVFEGDAEDGLEADLEAESYWKKHLPEDHILRCDKKDNFWEMGEIGPSGPCSEIHIDLRPEAERQQSAGADLVNKDHPQVVEIWNLVFIQYNRKADRSLEELPEKHIDTGMGFERLVMALQAKGSTYDTDIFDKTKAYLESLTGLMYPTASEPEQIAFRVIVDHIRAIVFTIADGELPSNTGAGYVIRRLLRRAARYGYATLNLDQPFMYKMVPMLAEQYGATFEEVAAQQEFIQRLIHEEEKGFLRKLASGTKMFESYIAELPEGAIVDGSFAFKLYDTYGFPIDLTELMAREAGREIDMDAFKAELEAQKNRSRKATEVKTGDWIAVSTLEGLPEFRGYDEMELETRIVQYRTVQAKKKQLYQVVLAETPFYAESGGQIGDQGSLTKGDETIKVIDTRRENELIIHLVNKLPADAGGTWIASVSAKRRQQIKANHTATHLLHAALRRHLGTHVEQRGSLVSEKSLRFDFSHFAKVTEEELGQIEAEVNAKIAQDIVLEEFREVPIEEAKGMGAMALFGEKYGDKVRVIVFDKSYSVELCGGTHVARTGEIRMFKLLSESSTAAGIRRVEALTGDRAWTYMQEQAASLSRISDSLKNPQNLEKAVSDLLDRNRDLEKELDQLNAEKVSRLKDSLLDLRKTHGDLHIIKAQVNVGSANDLKQLSFALKKETENTLVVLGAEVGTKALLSVIMSDDLAQSKRYNAGEIVRTLAREIKGGGGGQPFYATAGGKDPAGLGRALEGLEALLS